jgi:hypothetical protein
MGPFWDSAFSVTEPLGRSVVVAKGQHACQIPFVIIGKGTLRRKIAVLPNCAEYSLGPRNCQTLYFSFSVRA